MIQPYKSPSSALFPTACHIHPVFPQTAQCKTHCLPPACSAPCRTLANTFDTLDSLDWHLIYTLCTQRLRILVLSPPPLVLTPAPRSTRNEQLRQCVHRIENAEGARIILPSSPLQNTEKSSLPARPPRCQAVWLTRNQEIEGCKPPKINDLSEHTTGIGKSKNSKLAQMESTITPFTVFRPFL
jgi:hypothetical protein